MGVMCKRLLPLIPAGLVVDDVQVLPDGLTIHARPRSASATCPLCRRPSRRVHSRYVRVLADLPWQGQAVAIQVRARRFLCSTPDCARRVFAELLPGIVDRHGRRTRRLGEVQRHLGLALGGAPGTRLAARLGMCVSGDTLLRLVRRADRGAGDTADPDAELRVIGVDDWAWRRGRRWGTIVCDLERRRVVDLLPDRSAETLACWLERHPNVRVIARDRAGAYAEGARRGAPDAVQVADRWHLLVNASEAVLRVVERYRGAFSSAARAAMDGPAEIAVPPPRPPTKVEARQRERQAGRDARFGRIAELAAAGHGVRAIVRATGHSRNTVRRWVRRGSAPTWQKGQRATIIDPYLSHLQRRLAEGATNATVLWREIQALGFAGQVVMTRATVAKLRGMPARLPPPAPPWKCPSPRQATRMLLRDNVDAMDHRTRRFQDALLEAVPAIRRAVLEARAFNLLVREGDAAAFESWLEAARNGPLADFVDGLRRDYAAVAAALMLPWSNGQVEGHINRLKMIKRSMFGRAGLDLLRARLLAA